MNIAMEQTEEYVNGQLKEKYGDTFIRGNNGTKFCFGVYSKCFSDGSYFLLQFYISARRRGRQQVELHMFNLLDGHIMYHL